MQIDPQVLQTTAAIYILAGIINCFFGYRILKIILGFWGFIFGFSLALFLFNQIQGASATVSFIAGIVGGIIGVVAFTSLFKVGIFGIGAFLGYLIGMMASSASGAQPNVVVLVLLAILGGLVALFMRKPMIIVSTAFGGAWLIVRAFAYFKGVDFSILDLIEQPTIFKTRDTQFYIMFASWILLGLVGMALQFKLTAKKKIE